MAAPIIDLLEGKWDKFWKDFGNTTGEELVNPGGQSGSLSTGNTVYDKLTGTNAKPITSSSASAQNNNIVGSNLGAWALRIFIFIIGIVLIILGISDIIKNNKTVQSVVKAAAVA